MKPKKILMVMAIATLIISFGLATAYATTNIKNEKKDTGISIESKEKKVSSYKIKWDANGGKIGAKKTVVTSVKKGSKIGKLVKSPKRSEYIFKGWYTKKSGGTKINKNIKPKKSATLYAQWAKKGSTSTNSKLVGSWLRSDRVPLLMFNNNVQYTNQQRHYNFFNNGKFQFFYTSMEDNKTGNYKVSNGKITFTNIVWNYNGEIQEYPKTVVVEYRFEKVSSGKTCLKIPYLPNNAEKNYFSIDYGGLFSRMN